MLLLKSENENRNFYMKHFSVNCVACTEHKDLFIIATCNDGELKLVGGNSKYNGRLEICFDQKWTGIDAKGWTKSDTKVACKQLGYRNHGIMR